MKEITVIKLGGEILSDISSFQQVLQDIASLSCSTVLVHGGGKIADQVAEKLEVESRFLEGRRITPEPMRNVTVMVYGGLINGSIVAELQRNNCNAAGLTGADGRLLCAKKRVAEIDYGYVGDITSVNTEFLVRHLEHDTVPVVAPLTFSDTDGLLNTNADTIAATLAEHLAKMFRVRLLLCFGKPGVLQDASDDNSVIESLLMSEYQEMRANNTVAAGMLPKLENGFRALENGVGEVRILSWKNLAAAVEGKSAGTLLVNGER